MAVHNFRSQRLFVLNDLAKENTFFSSREQANYLLNVLRMKDGDEIIVFNGRDGEWLARVDVQGRKKCSLGPSKRLRTQPKSIGFTYCFAPLKQARLDYMIQKAVEMGASILQPVITQFTQVRNINLQRLHSNAVEAAEQCGILSIPAIREPVTLTNLINSMEKDRRLVFCDEGNPKSRPDEMDADLEKILILVGPEGGFSAEERALILAREETICLGLGPRILRADTAAVAAMAIVQASIGDWYDR